MIELHKSLYNTKYNYLFIQVQLHNICVGNSPQILCDNMNIITQIITYVYLYHHGITVVSCLHEFT